MEARMADSPPWHCEDLAPVPAGKGPPLVRASQPVRAPQRAGRSGGGVVDAPRGTLGLLAIADRLAIGLTLFAAIGLLVGGQGAGPSHVRDLAPIVITVPMR